MRKWRERIVIAFMLALGVLGLVVYVALFYAVIPYKIVPMLEDMAKSTVTMVTNSLGFTSPTDARCSQKGVHCDKNGRFVIRDMPGTDTPVPLLSVDLLDDLRKQETELQREPPNPDPKIARVQQFQLHAIVTAKNVMILVALGGDEKRGRFMECLGDTIKYPGIPIDTYDKCLVLVDPPLGVRTNNSGTTEPRHFKVPPRAPEP